MLQLPSSTTLPWHRVVNASGVLTCRDLTLRQPVSNGKGSGYTTVGWPWAATTESGWVMAMVGTTQQE